MPNHSRTRLKVNPSVMKKHIPDAPKTHPSRKSRSKTTGRPKTPTTGRSRSKGSFWKTVKVPIEWRDEERKVCGICYREDKTKEVKDGSRSQWKCGTCTFFINSPPSIAKTLHLQLCADNSQKVEGLCANPREWNMAMGRVARQNGYRK